MGKKVNKGFFSYLFIFLGIALAFVLVCAVIMLCNPGTKIFGLSYYKLEGSVKDFTSAVVYDSNGEPVKNEDGTNKTIELNTATTDVNNFKTIEINSNLFDVEFAQKSEDDAAGARQLLSILIDANAKGFTKGEITRLKFSPKYFQDTKTLQLNLEVPQGFINFKSSNKITVQLPKDFAGEFNIVVNSQAGNVKLGGSEGTSYTPNTLKASSVNVTTTTGNITTTKYFKSVNISKASSLKTDSGSITFDRPLICKELNVTTKTGEVKLTNDIITVASTFTFNAEHSFLTLNKITAPVINFAAKSGKIYAGELTGNVEFSDLTNNCDFQVSSIDGFLKIGTLNEENISTKTNVVIKKYVSSLCNICTTGDINITEIKGTTKIRTENGNINIAKVNGELDITSLSSAINLGKIADENGEVVSAGINKKVLISGSEYANITAYFNNVEDGSIISTTKGKMEIYLSTSVSCDITATAKIVSLNDIQRDVPFYYTVKSGTNKLTLTAPNDSITIKNM